MSRFNFQNAKPLLLERGAAAKPRRVVFLFAVAFPLPIRAPQIINRAVGDGLARPVNFQNAKPLLWSAERQRSSEGSFSLLPLPLICEAPLNVQRTATLLYCREAILSAHPIRQTTPSVCAKGANGHPVGFADGEPHFEVARGDREGKCFAF